METVAADKAVDDLLRDGSVFGVGGGSAAAAAVRRVAARVAAEGLRVRCVASGPVSRALVRSLGLELTELEAEEKVDLAVGGADEVDAAGNLLQSTGGQHTRDKCVAFFAENFVVAVSRSRVSERLGEKFRGGVTVEVLPMALVPVLRRIEQMGAKPVLRAAQSKMGPVVTDNAYFLVDADFGEIVDPVVLHRELKAIPGIVETSLFTGIAKKAYIGNPDGTVDVLTYQ